MSAEPLLDATARVVIVGASLAGLRAAERLRHLGFRGSLILIGDEPHEPYDRPRCPSRSLLGMAQARSGRGCRGSPISAMSSGGWGSPPRGWIGEQREVRLADGTTVSYDRLLIATGVRARPWFVPEQAALDGVVSVRTSEDGARAAFLARRTPEARAR